MKQKSTIAENQALNVMRPGSVYVSDRTDQLRYVDKNGTEGWVVPVSRYYAKDTILRGQAVSICQLSELDEGMAKDEFPYIRPTDPDKDDSCLGLACNYAKKGELVQVQNTGKFIFSKRYQELHNTDEELKELPVDFDNYGFGNVRGQRVYVKKFNEEFVTDDQNNQVQNFAGDFTFDLKESADVTKNTLQIGYLVDAPTEDELAAYDINDEDKDCEVVIELDVTGDTRGAIGATQSTVVLAEDIEFGDGPNELRVLAISTGDPTPAKFTVTQVVEKDFTFDSKKQYFMGFRKLDGKAVIISVGNDVTLSELTDPTDYGYYTLSKSFGDDFTQIKAESFADLESKIKEALEIVSGETPSTEDLALRNDDGYCSSYNIVNASCGGYYDMYISQELCRYVVGYTLNHGIAEGTKGRAVLADIRDDTRSNVVGICLSNSKGIRKAGETVVVMKQGTYTLKAADKNYNPENKLTLEPGARYILGYNGRITRTNEPNYHDTQVVIGQAENETTMFVDVSQPLYTYKGNMPIGYIKSSNGGQAEHGFLLMDGVTEYETQRYPELYEALLDWYSKEEIAGSDPAHFKIPESKSGNFYNEIRYKCEGLYRDVPRVPFLRANGVFTNNRTETLDITSLVRYGTLEQGMVAPTLDNVDIKLYYREPVGSPKNIDGMHWREVLPGFAVHNNTQLYGYDWEVVSSENDTLFKLVMNIEDGIGPCKVQASQPPISLEGFEYRIVVTARNLWTREYNVEEANPLATSMEQNSNNVAPSVTAVREWVKESVETKNLEVKDSLVANKAGVEVAVPFQSPNIKETKDSVNLLHKGTHQEPLFQDALDAHGALDASNCAKDENGHYVPVHGLVNAGAEGNIHAKDMAGMKPQQGKNDDTVTDKEGYIPYVNKNGEMVVGNNITIEHGLSSTKVTNDGKKVTVTTPVTTEEVVAGDIGTFTKSYKKDVEGNKYVELKEAVKAPSAELNEANVSTLSINKLIVGGKEVSEANFFGSSVAYKDVEKELIDTQVSNILDENPLVPNRDTDADGNAVDPVSLRDTPKTLDENVDDKAITEDIALAASKLGSALQALYELPLGLFRYKSEVKAYADNSSEVNEPKDLLGILVERVNQVRDKLDTIEGYTHPRNSLVAGDPSSFGKNDVTLDRDNATRRQVYNPYSYTEEEYASIKEYLNLITSNDELSQNILSSVGILFKAAKETQQRLLDVETAVYGYDAPTVPGNSEEHKAIVAARIDEELQEVLNNSPLLLGLNRIVRAMCLEIFDTAELEDLRNMVERDDSDTDSEDDTLKGKLTLASRLDQIDKILDTITDQAYALVSMYVEQQEETFDHLTIKIEGGADNRTEENGHQKIDVARLADYDKETDGTFDNLPGDADYTKSGEVTYGNVYEDAHTYNPIEDEKSIIKHWVTEDVVVNTNLYEKDPNGKEYKFKRFVLNEDKQPVYEEEIVSWLDAKVERINKKLDKVTETVYGVNDTVADEPNRIETVRKNVANLVDDLYKNRAFAVENKVERGDDTLRLPFKQVITGAEAHTEDAIPAKDNTRTTYENVEDHTSIITHIDNELWNFTIGQALIDADSNTNYIANDYSQKVEYSEGKFTFDTDRLTTEMADNPALNVKTYDRALSVIDIIRGELGTDHSFSHEVNTKDIWTAVGNEEVGRWLEPATTTAISNNRVKTVFNAELKYEVGKDTAHIAADVYSKDFVYATNAEVYLSRKNKDIESRITSVEAALDNIAHVFEVIKASDFEKRAYNNRGNLDVYSTASTLAPTDSKYRQRFEASQPLDAITTLLNKVTALENRNYTDSFIQSDELFDTYPCEVHQVGATIDIFKECFKPTSHSYVETNFDSYNNPDVKKAIKDMANGYYEVDGVLNGDSALFTSSADKVAGGLFAKYKDLATYFAGNGITEAKLYVVYANDTWANETVKGDVTATNGKLSKKILAAIVGEDNIVSSSEGTDKTGTKYTNDSEKFFFGVEQDVVTFVVVVKDFNLYVDHSELKETVKADNTKTIRASSDEHTFSVNHNSYGLKTDEGINFDPDDSTISGFKPVRVSGHSMKDYTILSMIYTAMANAQRSVENFKSATDSIEATDKLLNRGFNHLFSLITQLTGDLYGEPVNKLFSNGDFKIPGTDQKLKSAKVQASTAAEVLKSITEAKTSGEKAAALVEEAAAAMSSDIKPTDTFATIVNKLNSEARKRRDFILSMVDYITEMEKNKNADKNKIEELNKRVEALETIVTKALSCTNSKVEDTYVTSSNTKEKFSYNKYEYAQQSMINIRNEDKSTTAKSLEERVKQLEDGYSSINTKMPTNLKEGSIYLL